MKKYSKYGFLAAIVLLFGIVYIVFFRLNNQEKPDNTFMNTEQNGIGTEANIPRIPKLEEGVNVYELENEVFAALGKESVMISTDRSSGSGILWEIQQDELFIITTAHLTENFETGEAELWNSEKLFFAEEDVIKTEENDIAGIRISIEKEIYKELSEAGYKGTAGYTRSLTDVLEIGEKMWVIDSVYGAASGISTAQVASVEIYLEDYGVEMLLLYGEGENGMSGCPVYDENGYLAGMLSGMSEDMSTLAAVPTKAIMKFLETLN